MLALLKVAAVVAATLSSFLGVWQVANVLDLQPYLALTPGYGIGLSFNVLPSSSSDSSSPSSLPVAGLSSDPKIQDPVDEMTKSDAIANETGPWPAAADDVVPVVNASSIWSETDQEVRAAGREYAPIEVLVLDWLDLAFSYVKEWPSSVVEAITFGTVALFLLGGFVLIATPVYWALRLVDLRGFNTSVAAVPVLGGDHVVDVGTVSTQHGSSSLQASETIMEILAYATQISQACAAAAAAVKEDHRSESEGTLDQQRSDLQGEIISEVKTSTQTAVGQINTRVSKVEARIAAAWTELNEIKSASLTSMQALDTVKISVAGQEASIASILSDLVELKSGQVSDQALFSSVKTDVSDGGKNIESLSGEIKLLKSHLKGLGETSKKQGRENADLAEQLKEQQRLRQEEAAKYAAAAESRAAETLQTVSALNAALQQKVDVGQHGQLQTMQIQLGTDVSQLDKKVDLQLEQINQATVLMSDSSRTADGQLRQDMAEQRANLEAQIAELRAQVERSAAQPPAGPSAVMVVGKPSEEQATRAEDAKAPAPVALADQGKGKGKMTDLPSATTVGKQISSGLHVPAVKYDPEAAVRGEAAMMGSRFAPEAAVAGPATSTAAEQTSGLHVPAVKYDPMAAAKGKKEMMASRWATPEPPKVGPATGLGDSRWATPSNPPPSSSPSVASPTVAPSSTAPVAAPVATPPAPAGPVTPATPPQQPTDSQEPQTSPSSSAATSARAGPGPQGGRRRMTPGVHDHNLRSSRKNTFKKRLDQFPTHAREHAYSCQDRQSLLFADGSGWEWLNVVVTERKRWWEVDPPEGWSAPV